MWKIVTSDLIGTRVFCDLFSSFLARCCGSLYHLVAAPKKPSSLRSLLSVLYTSILLMELCKRQSIHLTTVNHFMEQNHVFISWYWKKYRWFIQLMCSQLNVPFWSKTKGVFFSFTRTVYTTASASKLVSGIAAKRCGGGSGSANGNRARSNYFQNPGHSVPYTLPISGSLKIFAKKGVSDSFISIIPRWWTRSTQKTREIPKDPRDFQKTLR